ncbi:MAG: signal peptidase bacterial type [Capsulimonas sp.]|nr:signal peptidase bacterial type [Capsulimonas sp.]
MSTSNFTDFLANLSLIWIVGVITFATAIRLALVRLPSPSARSVAEFLESGIVAIGLVFLLIRPFLIQAFFIPSASMEPTLLGQQGAGDHILVNKLGIRLHPPRREDITVFIAPPAAVEGTAEAASGTPVDYVKRLIGVPGDRIEAHAGRVAINGTEYSHYTLRQKFLENGLFGQEAMQRSVNEPGYDLQANFHLRFTDKGVTINGTVVPNTKIAELVTGQPSFPVTVTPGYTMRNGVRLDEPFTAEDPDYDLKIYEGQSLKADNGHYRLNGQPILYSEYAGYNKAPTGPLAPSTYYMMGDNRNDSKDSTEWGPLEGNRIVGKAQWIFWPLSRIQTLH